MVKKIIVWGLFVFVTCPVFALVINWQLDESDPAVDIYNVETIATPQPGLPTARMRTSIQVTKAASIATAQPTIESDVRVKNEIDKERQRRGINTPTPNPSKRGSFTSN